MVVAVATVVVNMVTVVTLVIVVGDVVSVTLSGEASLAELGLGGCCDCAGGGSGATLAVGTTVPATTKARQYCRGGAAVRL